MKPIALTLFLCSIAFLPAGVQAADADAKANANAEPVRMMQDIQDVFNKSKDTISQTINDRRKEKPDLNGQVLYEITVEANGSVNDSSKLAKSTLNDPKLEGALLKIIKKLDFGKARRPEKVTFQFPIDIPNEDKTKGADSTNTI